MLTQEQADRVRPILANMEQGARETLELIAQLRSILNEKEPSGTQPTTGSAHPAGEASALRKIAWGKKVSPEFRKFVIQMGEDFGINPDWLMACMAFETGERFTPNVKNPQSSATGLIQFMAATARDLGTTTQALAAMTAEEQLRYVWLYFRDKIKAHGPLRTLADVYMAILWPAAIGRDDDSPLWVAGSQAYAVNAGLDANKDHKITKREAAAKVQAKLERGMSPEFYG